MMAVRLRHRASSFLLKHAPFKLFSTIKRTGTNPPSETSTLILLRHGQSTWNATPTFTGWADPPLTEQGISQAVSTGDLLKERGYTHFTHAFSSELDRAIHTCELTLAGALGLDHDIDIETAWQLNERHYGELQGELKNDPQLIEKYGETDIIKWRREFYATPPGMSESHDHWRPPPAPLTESLHDAQIRIVNYWEDVILPTLLSEGGNTVLIAAHSNTLRALLSHIDNIPPQNIPQIHVPNSVPCVYQYSTNTGEIISPLLQSSKEEGVYSHGQWLFSKENYQRLRGKIGGSGSFTRAMFQAWDLNGDGVLSKDEIEIGLKDIMENAQDAAVGAIAAKILEEVDKDGNEVLDMEEFDQFALIAANRLMPSLMEQH